MITTSQTSRRIPAFLASAAVAAAFAFGASSAQAQSAESFYKGKPLRVIIPSGEGGGYDAYTRLLSRHLDRHIPGRPKLVTQNMPGASGLRGTNWLYTVAPRDGTVMGATYNTLLTDPLMGNSTAQFDPQKFEWIGSMATQYNACMVWHTSSIKSIQDATKREVLVSTTGMAGNSALTPLMVNKLLGTKFKVISGYKTTEMRLAVERGEVEGICGLSYDTYVAANPEWLSAKKIRFILQAGTKGVKELPDTPLLINLIKDDKQKEALRLLGMREELGRPHMFPPEVPKYLVTALRRAFDATMKDPTFLAEAKKMKLEIDALTGEEMDTKVRAAYAAPKDVVAIAAKLWPPAIPKGKKAKKAQ